ncbi:hypothetical protein AB0M95_27580 [Sphaerisporangium sp. NPDC051017]|uniref:DUF7739 domain-containing protein n=1 Tax=Sphaerisporangium sp. NPDC051017 TaxID=3154636 RepID=UPI0034314B35
MGFYFGPRARHISCLHSQQLATLLTEAGARDSQGAARLLDFMDHGSEDTLTPREAGQAARSLRRVAGRLRHQIDRNTVERIATDAHDATTTGRNWTVGP